MKWSLRLGRFLGIDVYLHFTFLVFIAIVAYLTQASLGTLAFFAAAFTCVTLHEYGHALTARRFGIATHDITLLPIGGVARLEKMPDNPRQELLVAVAGPAVNLVIAALLWGVCLILRIDPTIHGVDEMIHGRHDLLVTLLWWNLTMIAFNMLPAFPMDGGRVLRAILAMNMNYGKATRWAATVGKVMALLFACYALYVNHIMLIVVAFFVWSGASQEAVMAEEKVALNGVRVRDAMITDFRRVSPEETSGTLAQLILAGWQTDFPVIYDGQVVGLVTWRDVIAGLNAGHTVAVSSFMHHPIPACQLNEPLEVVLERMREAGLPLLPVVEDGRLLGLVTPENTVEFMAIRRALEQRA